MSREFVKIRWDALDVEVKAELLSEFNPKICAELKKTFPYRSVQSHAVVAGGQMYCPYRLIIDPQDCNTEDMSQQPPGRMNMELDFQYLSINYDEITEGVPAVAVLQVVEEDVPKLPEIGKRVWENLLFGEDYILVTFELTGGEGNE